jgi:hypothetical protein
MKTFKYKLRAECAFDLAHLMTEINMRSFKATKVKENFPDMEATFKTHLSLDEVKSKISNITDGHVMLETVALEKDYTGERK